MTHLRLAVIGFGQLGRACVRALLECHDLELAGVVRHGPPAPLPPPLERTPVVGHVRELAKIDCALLCVPVQQTLPVAREILQQHVPLVECARMEGPAAAEYYAALGVAARHHRVPAVVGAGWDPGVLPNMRRLFEVLILRGRTEATAHPGVSLRHSALDSIQGVEEALACERRASDGRKQHYVYVRVGKHANLENIERAIAADPLYAGEETFVFPVTDMAEFEAASGIVLQRNETGSADAHRSLLFEARFKVSSFAANVMLDAGRALPSLAPGAHRYRFGL